MNLRRLRRNRHINELTKEVRISSKQMIQPYFAIEGIKAEESIQGLTGVYRETPDSLLKRIESDLEKGVSKGILFSVGASKGTKEFTYDFSAKQIEGVKSRFGKDFWLSVDVCLCSSMCPYCCLVFSFMICPVCLSELLFVFCQVFTRGGTRCLPSCSSTFLLTQCFCLFRLIFCLSMFPVCRSVWLSVCLFCCMFVDIYFSLSFPSRRRSFGGIRHRRGCFC